MFQSDKTRLAVVVVVAALLALAGLTPATAQETEDEKTLYALGAIMAQNLGPFALTDAELQSVMLGLRDGVLGNELAVDMGTYGPKVQQMAQSRQQAAASVNQEASDAFVAKKAAEEGAMTTESGMVFKPITEGTGNSPSATSRVTVHYHGTLRRRHRLRQLRRPRRARHLRPRPGDPVLDRGPAEDEGRRQGRADLPAGPGLRLRAGRGAFRRAAALVFEVELISIEG